MTDPVRASDIAPEDPEFCWRDRIPCKMLTVIGGPPEVGKGMLTCLIAAEVSQGGGNVLMSAWEDSESITQRPRLQVAGANLDLVDLWRFRLPSMFDELEERLTEKHIELLVMDPFPSHLNAGVSRHSDSIRRVTDPLIELCERCDTAVIVVEHVLKNISAHGHPLSAIPGTGSGLAAACRMAYIVGADPADSDRRIMACVKHAICDKMPEISFQTDVVEIAGLTTEFPKLVYEGELEFDALTLLLRGKTKGKGRNAAKKAAAAEWLVRYLYTAYQEGREVIMGTAYQDGLQYGYTKRTLQAARQDVDAVMDPVGGGRNAKVHLGDDLLARLNKVHGAPAQKVVAKKGKDGQDFLDGSASDLDAELKNLLGGGKDGK